MQFRTNPTPADDTFTTTFNTGNAAFYGEPHDDEAPTRDPHETARILREMADKLEDGHLTGHVLDSNGNNIGGWAWN